MLDLRRENVGRARPAAFALALVLSAASLTPISGASAAMAPSAGKPKARPAQPAKRPPPLPAAEVAALQQRIQGRDAEDIQAALATVRSAGPTAAALAPAIEQLLRRGATLPLLRAAMKTLGALAQTSSSAALAPYVRHRVEELRHEAARAIVTTGGPDAVAALREALHAGDATLRGLAATGLGAMNARDALPDLFEALDRGVPQAASAIGLVCDPAACQKLLGKLGTISFDVMASGLEALLLRSPPLPEAVQLEVVQRVRNLATPDARRLLLDVGSHFPADGQARVRAAVEAATAAMPHNDDDPPNTGAGEARP
ncbi:Hypothetical protein CAP_4922 [Chondromyces apiculatus DSM 436]|uniref:HEAT repeat domain-containing protein n=1 Tax=Chondromyces apiculatus DSM 436 TaxID=1192034 RepID=A0A017T487_9BACT|nr:Hypothetical protein CAP_4922 [Chondromyces apiculatus DSM 436]